MSEVKVSEPIPGTLWVCTEVSVALIQDDDQAEEVKAVLGELIYEAARAGVSDG